MEVRRAEYLVKYIFSSAQTIVVAQQGNPRHAQAKQDVALKDELVRGAKVGKVTSVQDKVYVLSFVYAPDKIFRFIVPPLGVANEGKADGIFSVKCCLNTLDVLLVQVLFSPH